MYKKIPTVSSRFNPTKALSVGVLLMAIMVTYAMRVSA
jgi:hypothetical protein